MSEIKESYISSLVLANDLIGGKWKSRVLWHILRGENRFSSLKKAIPEISEKVLYSTLRELEETGLIGREIVENKPQKTVCYFLQQEQEMLRELLELLSRFSHCYAQKNQIKLEKMHDTGKTSCKVNQRTA